MKTAMILTFSKVDNRGANLQAYAMMRILQGKGYEVEFLDIQLHTMPKNLLGKIRPFVNNFLAGRFRKSVGFHFTKTYNSLQQLMADPPKADLFLVGSDQVWNPLITHSLDARLFFFKFLPREVKKVAYAASFGEKYWPKGNHEEEIKTLLNNFSGISVREESGLSILSQTFNVNNASVVLDPTLLLNDDDLHRLIGSFPASGGGCYSYLLYESPEIIELCDSICALYSYPLLSNKNSLLMKLRSIHSVKKWLKNIARADMVITNSFHCLVFSILFKKEFIVIPPCPGREDRMLTLLKHLNLEYRYVTNSLDLKQKNNLLQNNIDYSVVMKLLDRKRDESISFIDMTC